MNRVRLGVVMDPICAIKPWKDTTLAMLLAAQARGWDIEYMEPSWLHARDGEAFARMQPLSVSDDNHDWFRLQPPRVLPLAELDIVLMRQDPPVDMEFLYVTQILELAERAGVLVANRPAAIRTANEKLLAQHYPDLCPPTLVTRDLDQLQAFLEEQGEIVVKPLDAMGGASVFRLGPGDPNARVIFETMTGHGQHTTMAQRFEPAVRVGDRRVLLIDGEPIPHALLRVPPEGSFRANLAAGGRGEVVALRPRDREIAATVGPELAAAGLRFVGLDVIGDSLTEINVTSPTCAREIQAATGIDIGGQFLDALRATSHST
ncbi:MAG: glutathione synthase [Halothiobacillaceae bacterium]